RLQQHQSLHYSLGKKDVLVWRTPVLLPLHALILTHISYGWTRELVGLAVLPPLHLLF
ncbi:unnamed protein product, partial [Musa hybrid cultivar]